MENTKKSVNAKTTFLIVCEPTFLFYNKVRIKGSNFLCILKPKLYLWDVCFRKEAAALCLLSFTAI
jgi:hypothetical protein